jgi:Na+/Pi-cotransporter
MDNPTKDGCTTVGLIKCHEDFGCPAFFDTGATSKDDVLSGVIVFVIGLALLFSCLFLLIKVLNHVIWGVSTRIINKATDVNPYIAIVIGLGLTTVIQSSSVVTSTLTPLCGVGVLSLEQMFPLTLGANLGTTLTGIMAALLSDTHAMQVALAHLFFNVTGVLIWFPIPFMRAVPLTIARFNGRTARVWRLYPFLYISVAFLLVPLVLLGISTKFTSKFLNISCGIAVVVVFLFLAWNVESQSRQWAIGEGEETRCCRRLLWWRRSLPSEGPGEDSSDSDAYNSSEGDEDSSEGYGEDQPKTYRPRPLSTMANKGSGDADDAEEPVTKRLSESNGKSGISVIADVTAFSMDESE